MQNFLWEGLWRMEEVERKHTGLEYTRSLIHLYTKFVKVEYGNKTQIRNTSITNRKEWTY
ncbi:Uncharacterised protein [uncultured archaeon]|nr:Uncharacterised protein [uncultured archaeon]